MARKRGGKENPKRSVRSTPSAGRRLATPDSPRRIIPWLAVMIVTALGVRVAMLSEYWRNNPIAKTPIVDGAFYWNLAARYASGDLIGDTPFLSAPLYPYVLGGVRALGVGLIGAYLLHVALHLATAAVLARIAMRRFSRMAGLLAAAVFLLLDEPAIGCFRILSDSLQLFVLAICWASIAAAQAKPTSVRWAIAGVMLGLLCLTNASLVLVGPPLAVWIALTVLPRPTAARRAGVLLGACCLTLAPATLHNFYVCDEFIPISAHSGIALRHGNAPGAIGTYTAAPGVSIDQSRQHKDAFAVYERETGHPGTWRTVDRFFRRQAFDFWKADPARAAMLCLRKAYWFLTARNYGDVHIPALEAETGLDPRWRLAPLATAWLWPIALAAAAAWSRRWRTYAPELLLLLVPLVVVMVFWYSPRYRLPAIPVVAVAAGWMLSRAFTPGAPMKTRATLVAAVLVAVSLQWVNRATGFDALDGVRVRYHNNLAGLLARQGRVDEAVDAYRQTLQYAPRDATANAFVGTALVRSGDPRGALDYLERAIDADPDDAATHAAAGTALLRLKRFDRAEREFNEALRLEPDNEFAHLNLAGAMLLRDRDDEAAEHYRTVLRINPDAVDAWLRLGIALQRSGQRDTAVETYRQGLTRARAAGRTDVVEQIETRLSKLTPE